MFQVVRMFHRQPLEDTVCGCVASGRVHILDPMKVHREGFYDSIQFLVGVNL